MDAGVIHRDRAHWKRARREGLILRGALGFHEAETVCKWQVTLLQSSEAKPGWELSDLEVTTTLTPSRIRRPGRVQKMKCRSTDEGSTMEQPGCAEQDRRKIRRDLCHGSHGMEDGIQEEEQQELLRGPRKRAELEGLLVC